MEVHARAPEPLINNGDMASNWQSWKEDFIIFMKVTGYIDKPDEIRANLLKNRIGKVGIDAIQNISFDNVRDTDNMDILIEKLEKYFNPPKNEVVERYNFFTRGKKHNESVEQYINILKEKAKNCNFNDMLDSIIRDKIILETHDKILRKKFFEADNLDLSKLVAIYHDYNINTEKMKQVTKETRADPTTSIPKPSGNFVRRACWRCDEQHPLGKCPAWGSKCTKCGDVNHFTQCCKSFKFKMNKVNKNLLDPTVQQTKPLNSKSNDKWNNQADSVKTKDSVNKMIFPDVPTNLNYINTTNYSTNFPKSTQYSHSYMNLIQPDGISDLRNRGENVQPKQTKTPSAGTSQERYSSKPWLVGTRTNASHITQKFPTNQRKKSDDSCILT